MILAGIRQRNECCESAQYQLHCRVDEGAAFTLEGLSATPNTWSDNVSWQADGHGVYVIQLTE